MKKLKIVGIVFIVFLCMSLTTVAYFNNSNQSVQKQVTQNSKHHEHQLETKILVQPSATQDGIEQEFCTKCNYKNNKPYVCKHDTTTEIISKEPSCTEEGVKETICKRCNKILNSTSLSKIDHIYNDWTSITDTKMSRTCQNCRNTEEKEIEKNEENFQNDEYEAENTEALQNNSIFIPSVDLKEGFAITDFTQASVDNNNIICTYAYEIGYDENDPFILGHNTHSLKVLKYVSVNDLIYLNINGTIETYQVVVSELGTTENDGTDIVGLTTGSSIYDNLGTKTIHLYTCNNECVNGRWIVLAKKI